MTNTYYHLSVNQLSPGTVLESRFGVSNRERRIYDIVHSAIVEGPLVLKSILLAESYLLAAQDHDGCLPMYLKEIIFEQIRKEQFPNRPPRLGSKFLCPTLGDINKLKATFPERTYVYSCEINEGVSATLDLIFARSTTNLFPIDAQLNQLRTDAFHYWNGDLSNNPIMEVVTSGKVIILDIVV